MAYDPADRFQHLVAIHAARWAFDISYFAAGLRVPPALRQAAVAIRGDPHDVAATVLATDAPDRVAVPVHAHEERRLACAVVADGKPKNQRS